MHFILIYFQGRNYELFSIYLFKINFIILLFKQFRAAATLILLKYGRHTIELLHGRVELIIRVGVEETLDGGRGDSVSPELVCLLQHLLYVVLRQTSTFAFLFNISTFWLLKSIVYLHIFAEVLLVSSSSTRAPQL